jgi:hypothetical protein
VVKRNPARDGIFIERKITRLFSGAESLGRRWGSSHRHKQKGLMHGGDEPGGSLINIIARRKNNCLRSFYKHFSPSEMNLDITRYFSLLPSISFQYLKKNIKDTLKPCQMEKTKKPE